MIVIMFCGGILGKSHHLNEMYFLISEDLIIPCMSMVLIILMLLLICYGLYKLMALIDSHDILEKFFDRSPAMLGVAELAGEKTYHIRANIAFYRFLNSNENDFGHLEESGLSYDLILKMRESCLRSKQLRQAISFEYLYDSLVFFVTVNMNGVQSNGNIRFTYVLENITASANSLKSLAINEERLKFALEGSNDGLWDWNLESNNMFFSPRWAEMIGYTPEEIKSSVDSWTTLIHPDDLSRVMQELNDHVQGKTNQFLTEYRLKTKGGGWTWVLDRGKVIKRDNDTGKAIRIVGTHKDLTRTKTLEETLRKNEQKLKDMMNFAPAAIFTLNEEGKCLFTNYGWSEITGLTQKDSFYIDWFSIVSSADQDYVKKNWRNAEAMELIIVNPDGQERRVICKIKRIESSDGEFMHYMGSIQDITHFRSLQKETDFYRMALDKAAIVATTDRNGIITYVNEMFCEISGYSREELIGANHRILNSGQMPGDFFKDMWKSISSGLIWRDEICNRAKDGTLYWVDTTIVPQFDEQGNIYQFAAIRNEITQRKKLEAELLDANIAAMEASKAKSDFLANVSHEIRTPMNGIIGMCNLILADGLESRIAEKVTIIKQSSNTLLHLINNILDFSKIEADKIELENESFRIKDCANEVLNILSPLAIQKGVRLSYHQNNDVPEIVAGDKTRLLQVLLNLAGNGLKFTHSGKVEIYSSVIRLHENKYELQFDIKDTGIGIPPDAIKRLFSSFSQVDASTTRMYGGSGLGLAISKGLCEKMGGIIWVTSEENKGSVFSFTMKIFKADSVQEDKELVLSKEFAETYPQSILIAEDNKTNQIVLCGILERLGYSPDIASDGFQVLEKISAKKYDLIFMDFHMPGLDGLETTRQIRKRGVFHVRIVAVTANALNEKFEECMEAGMNGVLLKPIVISELVSTLKDTQPLTVPEIDLAPSDTIIDIESFYRNFEGFEDIAESTIKEFIESIPTFLDRIRSAIENRNPEELEISAHTFKGAISNFQARKAVNVIHNLELMGANKNIDNAQLQFVMILQEVEKVRAELERIIKGRETA